MNNESYPRSNIETSKDVEMQRKESGESHSSEELRTKLTGILIETLYRFEGSEITSKRLHRALNERSAARRISREGEARLGREDSREADPAGP